RTAGLVLLGRRRTPEDRRRPQGREEAGAHARDRDLHRRSPSGERLSLGPDAGHRFERAALRGEIEEVRTGKWPARVDARRPFVDTNELLWRLEAQRPKHDPPQHAED